MMSRIKDECWFRANQYIARGNKTRALEICKDSRCLTSISCIKYIAWEYYDDHDYSEATLWFKKGQDLKDPECFYGAASSQLMLENYSIAYNEFLKAYDAGYYRASYWIGNMYEYGFGVEKDTVKASVYYKSGSDRGYLAARKGYLRMLRKNGGIMEKFLYYPRLLALIVKTTLVAVLNVDDEMLADLPNKYR